MLAQDTSQGTPSSPSATTGPGSADGSEAPLTNLPASPSEDLGPYAAALAAAPEAALSVTGLLLGAMWGGLLGWGAAALTKQSNPMTWALAGAAAGGTALAVVGYLKGQELDSWLQAQTTPSTSSEPTPSTMA